MQDANGSLGCHLEKVIFSIYGFKGAEIALSLISNSDVMAV